MSKLDYTLIAIFVMGAAAVIFAFWEGTAV